MNTTNTFDDTLRVLEWARKMRGSDQTVATFWKSLADAVREPESVSAERLLSELGAYGGNTLVNLVRRKGVPYPEVARDVAKTLAPTFGKGAPNG